MEKINIKELFNQPKVICIVGNPNEAKSNLVYHLIDEAKKNFKFNLVTFGLKVDVGGSKINSVKELEQVKNSAVFLDEFNTLFNLEERIYKSDVENTLRIIYHNNNILVLIGLGENYKKFISARANVIIYKKVFYDDLINGSRVKKVLMDFNDVENIKGSSVLNLEKNQALIYDNKYRLIEVPYLKEYDTKLNNPLILTKK